MHLQEVKEIETLACYILQNGLMRGFLNETCSRKSRISTVNRRRYRTRIPYLFRVQKMFLLQRGGTANMLRPLSFI